MEPSFLIDHACWSMKCSSSRLPQVQTTPHGLRMNSRLGMLKIDGYIPSKGRHWKANGRSSKIQHFKVWLCCQNRTCPLSLGG
ncbi:hypothetical protein Leryth_009513 [Lithospermum erythrorhizon]|nr:hypothetical protein Leryth_009513 [Lithospermum erythrorhizon]